MSNKPRPLSETEMRQVTGGISQNLHQPSSAARYLNQLLTDLNLALERISDLEDRLDKLTNTKTPKSDKKSVSAIDSI